MKYHNITTQIKNILDNNNIWYETFEHEPVRTSEEASKVRHGYTIKQGAKAIIVRIKISSNDKRFVMLVVPGDLKFDSNKIKSLYNAKDIRFATEEEVHKITSGVLPGGVSPFGNLFKLEVIADKKLFDNEKIIFNAGDKRFSIGMNSQDYTTIVKPKIVDIC